MEALPLSSGGDGGCGWLAGWHTRGAAGSTSATIAETVSCGRTGRWPAETAALLRRPVISDSASLPLGYNSRTIQNRRSSVFIGG